MISKELLTSIEKANIVTGTKLASGNLRKIKKTIMRKRKESVTLLCSCVFSLIDAYALQGTSYSTAL